MTRSVNVMVVAYGTAKKSSFTGSASVVKGYELQKRVTGNITKSIEGTVAGLQVTSGGGQPGEGASIMIRGIGSINAVSTPLYVVDGIPYDGSLSAINPADIESLTVLKDASAGRSTEPEEPTASLSSQPRKARRTSVRSSATRAAPDSLAFHQTVRPRRHRRFHRTDLRVPQEQRAVQHGNGFRGCERIRRGEPRPNHRRSQESWILQPVQELHLVNPHRPGHRQDQG